VNQGYDHPSMMQNILQTLDFKHISLQSLSTDWQNQFFFLSGYNWAQVNDSMKKHKSPKLYMGIKRIIYNRRRKTHKNTTTKKKNRKNHQCPHHNTWRNK